MEKIYGVPLKLRYLLPLYSNPKHGLMENVIVIAQETAPLEEYFESVIAEAEVEKENVKRPLKRLNGVSHKSRSIQLLMISRYLRSH